MHCNCRYYSLTAAHPVRVTRLLELSQCTNQGEGGEVGCDVLCCATASSVSGCIFIHCAAEICQQARLHHLSLCQTNSQQNNKLTTIIIIIFVECCECVKLPRCCGKGVNKAEQKHQTEICKAFNNQIHSCRVKRLQLDSSIIYMMGTEYEKSVIYVFQHVAGPNCRGARVDHCCSVQKCR